MLHQRRQAIQRGFTLIELLIVILIVSLVYFLGFSGYEIDKKKPKALTPLNLKQSIRSASPTRHTSLLCINKCKTCLLRRDIGASYEPYENNIDLSDIKAYRLDGSNTLERIEYERYDDERICLQMDFYPNGSSTQIILENKTGTYYLPAYFDEPKQFESPEDAQEYWIEKTKLVSDAGAMY